MNKCIYFKEFSADGAKKWDKSGRNSGKYGILFFIYQRVNNNIHILKEIIKKEN